MKKILSIICILSLVSACAPLDTQNQYSSIDIGRPVDVEFGRVVAMRVVKVQHQSTGVGQGAGILAGAGAGSAVGNGNGKLAAVLIGAIVGGVAGSIAEQQYQNMKGIEYTITKRSGKTVTIVQNIGKDDTPIAVGHRVMIQEQGQYMRVLPAEALPTKVKKPADIQVVE